MRISTRIAPLLLASCLVAGCSSSTESPGSITNTPTASNPGISASPHDKNLSESKETKENGETAKDLQSYLAESGRLDASKVKGRLVKDKGALEVICKQLLNASLDPYTLSDEMYDKLKLEFDDAMKRYYNRTDDSLVFILASTSQPEIIEKDNQTVFKYRGLLAKSPYLRGRDTAYTAEKIADTYASVKGGEIEPYPIIFTFTEKDGKTIVHLDVKG